MGWRTTSSAVDFCPYLGPDPGATPQRRRISRYRAGSWLAAAALVTAWLVCPVSADEPAAENTYAEMDLEQLMSIQVSSVAGVDQGWLSTPAAVYVINSEDIARSGHQFLPELFRDVPGMNVSRITAHDWGVSARGFNGNLNNKLQAVIDGREIYNAAFGGVTWQLHDLILDDIEQIEVVRGPGATLWGSSAVNGVLNIKTKNARDTQGLYLKQVVGTELRDITAVRYGGKINDDTYYRVWGKYVNHDAGEPAPGLGEVDDWNMSQGGFRLDHDGADGATFMIEGGLFYSNQTGESATVPGPVPFTTVSRVKADDRHGGYLTVRLEQNLPNDEGWSVTTFVNQWYMGLPMGLGLGDVNGGFDWRCRWNLSTAQKLIWGLGYRAEYYDVSPAANLTFTPTHDTLQTVNGFVQDTITLKPDRWFVMLGSKFGHNEFSGFEVQPSARLWWTPDDRQTVWASISRAVSQPSSYDQRLTLGIVNTPFPPPNNVVELRGSNVDAEELTAYELGYRQQVNPDLMLDIAAFFNQYRHLVGPTAVAEDQVLINCTAGDFYGLEAAAQWKPADNLRLTGSYSLLKIDTRGIHAAEIEANEPTHQVKLRGDYGLTDNLTVHSAVYYVDDSVDYAPFWRLDAGFTWQINGRTDLSVWGQNLLEPSHPEHIHATSFADFETQRGVYVQLRYRF